MMEVGQLRDPFGARSAKERGPLITEGSYRNGKTEIYRKGKWEPVNIIHAGQRAMVNGKMRTADGKGNWYDPKDPGKYSHETGEFERQTYGTYKPGEDRTPSKPPAYKPNPGVKPSSFLKTENPTQNPERPTTPGVSGTEVPALGGNTYSVMGVKYDSATGQAINPSTGKTSSGGYSIKPKTAGRTDYSGGETRIDAKGNVQKGTSTSPKPMTMDDANNLLTGGYKMNQDYASNQLPYTQSSPYAGKGNAEIYNSETLLQHQQGPGAPDYVKLSKDIYGDQSGVESYTRSGEMNKDYEQMDVDLGQSTSGKPEKSIPKRPSGARQAEKWDRKYGRADFSGKSEAPATSGFDMKRRAAFLGAKTSMEGLRRSEATQNMAERNGDYFIGDGKGGENLIKLENKEDRLTYKSGPEGARQIRDKYVNALTSKEDAPAPLPDSEQAAGNVEASAGQKPLTVAPSDIPSDLSGTAGEEYLRKLDAGLLTRKQ